MDLRKARFPEIKRPSRPSPTVVRGLENDIDEIETEVFSGNAGVSRRIYQLTREAIEFQRAVELLTGILSGLVAGSRRTA